MAIATISTKGQIVIPAKIRKMLGITARSKVRITVSDDNTKMVIEPLPDDPIESLTGIFANYQGSLADELIAERKKDIGSEEA